MAMMDWYQAGVGLASAPAMGATDALKLEDMKMNMGLKGAETQQILANQALQARTNELLKGADVSTPQGMIKTGQGLMSVNPKVGMEFVQQGGLMQKAEDDTIRATMTDYLKAIEEARQRNDDKGLQSVLAEMKSNPLLAKRGIFQNVTMNMGTDGAMTTVAEFDKSHLASMAQQVTDPDLKQSMLSAPPGKYEIKKDKSGKIVEFKPVTEASTEYKDYIDEQMKAGKGKSEAIKSWEKSQDERAKQKIQFGVTVRGAETEKREKRQASQSMDLLTTAIGGQENLDYYAERYVRYKELPPIGMGANNRWAFFGYAAKWARENGMDAKSAEISQMQTGAAKTALGNISKVEAVSKVAGETAISHGEAALKIMDKKDRTGSPVVDRWVRGGMKAIVGDPDVTAFDTNVHFFNREVARYLTSMTAGGIMNQKESDEIQALISPNQNPKQFAKNYKTAVGLIKQKEEQFTRVKQDITSGLPGGTPGEAGGKTQKIGRFTVEVSQ